MQSRLPGSSRRPQVLHSRRASHSGHRFQFSLTSFPQSGQDRATSRNSHAGQIFQPALVGSPQLGQIKVSLSGEFMVSIFGKIIAHIHPAAGRAWNTLQFLQFLA
jgi:hypothetical protein